ncbi:uncharacterized protein LOC118433512 [Folsomia candida]|uniref:uncharacterized protein LOC118433512 n=1 Tax=Folsomia candida TaxID=158441 RepID=UPI001604D00D|nr:uncharacterized protein LOC118433512 [Folsomia candida]
MTFPNLKTLALDTLHKMELGGMELGVVLEACTNLDMKLDRLDLWLPAYPERMRDVIDGLLKGDKLYKDLNRIEIRPHIRNRTRHDLTYAEKYLFKGLLAELEGMDQIVIHGLYFGDESLKNLRDFMASNEMPESKFNVLQVGWTDDDEERDGSDSE